MWAVVLAHSQDTVPFTIALLPSSWLMLLQIHNDLSIDRLVGIAEQAGKAIMDIFHGDADKWDVDHKADNSPLTRADREANTIICDALSAWTPHIPIISEELTVAPYSTRQVQTRSAVCGVLHCAVRASCFKWVFRRMLFILTCCSDPAYICITGPSIAPHAPALHWPSAA